MISSEAKREFANEVARRLSDAGYQALWAGGCVRDFLLGIEPEDYDIATNARPEEVRKIFGQRKTLAVGASFGVIIVIGPKSAGNVEVATFRTEGPYLDGRRPDNVAFSTAEEDAHRRDFTINGMFYDPLEQQVLDYVNGQHDLSQGVIRAIGNPRDRMTEDKLRLLRAVRFSARFEFELDPETATAVKDMAEEIKVVSVERISHELRRMLCHRHRRRAVQLLHGLRLMSGILPEVQPFAGQAENDAFQTTLHMLHLLRDPSFELAAAVLLHSSTDPIPIACDDRTFSSLLAEKQIEPVHSICRRLRLSNHEIEDISWLVGHRAFPAAVWKSERAHLKRLMARPVINELLDLARVEALATDADVSDIVACEEYLRDTPPDEIDPPPLLTGDALRDMGLEPGKQFKVILESVRDAQLNDEISTSQQARDFVRQLIDGDADGKK